LSTCLFKRKTLSLFLRHLPREFPKTGLCSPNYTIVVEISGYVLQVTDRRSCVPCKRKQEAHLIIETDLCSNYITTCVLVHNGCFVSCFKTP